MYESLNLAFHVGDDPVVVASNRRVIGAAQFMNQVHGDELRRGLSVKAGLGVI